MHRVIVGFLAVVAPTLLMAESLSYPRNHLMYDQSGRESAMILRCERNISNEILICDLVTQYLRFMSDAEYMAEHDTIKKDIAKLAEEEEDILGETASLCEGMASIDMEAELIERYESEDFRDIGRQYIQQINALCDGDSIEEVTAAYLEMAYIELKQRALTCTVGFSLSELEFTLSASGNAWVHDSDSTVDACDMRTTATISQYDEWKWEYRQTRIPLSGSCDNESDVQVYKTDSVKTFEAQCSAVGFSALPF